MIVTWLIHSYFINENTCYFIHAACNLIISKFVIIIIVAKNISKMYYNWLCLQIIIDNKDVTNLSHASKASMIAKVMQDPKISTIENMTIFQN